MASSMTRPRRTICYCSGTLRKRNAARRGIMFQGYIKLHLRPFRPKYRLQNLSGFSRKSSPRSWLQIPYSSQNCDSASMNRNGTELFLTSLQYFFKKVTIYPNFFYTKILRILNRLTWGSVVLEGSIFTLYEDWKQGFEWKSHLCAWRYSARAFLALRHRKFGLGLIGAVPVC